MVQAKLTKGYIFDIQGFSVHDGPGCRTLIFFKGCSLECAWCSNPEGISHFPEPLYRESKCNFDGLCIKACPYEAISISDNGNGKELIFNRDICVKCNSHVCVNTCYSGALNLGGFETSTEDLFTRISRDRPYWGSNGGITLTGGEPFAQPEFALEFLNRCYDAYIHTAVETCGNVPWKNYEKSLPFIDWIFYDLKTMDESRSNQITGLPPVNLLTVSPRHSPTRSSLQAPPTTPIGQIQENARHLASIFPGRLIFRLPVIPGFNDDMHNISETARFIHSVGRNEINILPLHHLGREKYKLVGKEYQMTGLKIPGIDELQKIETQFASLGITCYTGSETPF